MAVLRVSEYEIGNSVTFNTVEECEKLSAYLKLQLEDNSALDEMDENDAAIIKIMHGGIGVIDVNGSRTYHVSSYKKIGDIPLDLTNY
jgi:hypothetical protein